MVVPLKRLEYIPGPFKYIIPAIISDVVKIPSKRRIKASLFFLSLSLLFFAFLYNVIVNKTNANKKKPYVRFTQVRKFDRNILKHNTMPSWLINHCCFRLTGIKALNPVVDTLLFLHKDNIAYFFIQSLNTYIKAVKGRKIFIFVDLTLKKYFPENAIKITTNNHSNVLV